MPAAWRSFLLFLLSMAPLALLVVLWDASFFSAWSGQVVSLAPSPVTEPVTREVRIWEGNGRQVTRVLWPVTALEGLELPTTRVAAAPDEVPDTMPSTEKARFSLSYTVTPADGPTRTIPTTSPRSLGMGLLALAALAALRNMVVAGSPIALERLQTANATAAPTAPERGRPSRPRGGGQKGPPPGKRRRGRGRR